MPFPKKFRVNKLLPIIVIFLSFCRIYIGRLALDKVNTVNYVCQLNAPCSPLMILATSFSMFSLLNLTVKMISYAPQCAAIFFPTSAFDIL